MRRFFSLLFILTLLQPLAHGASKLSNVLLHPGETIYARFELAGRKIKLVSVSKDPDDSAQVVATLQLKPDGSALLMRIENKFPKDLNYKAEARATKIDRQMRFGVAPVVAGKVGLETLPTVVDEVALYDFKLQK